MMSILATAYMTVDVSYSQYIIYSLAIIHMAMWALISINAQAH